jgi:hypothetical protein
MFCGRQFVDARYRTRKGVAQLRQYASPSFRREA